MFANLFFGVTEEEKERAVATIVERASPRHEFFLMMALAIAMASMGVLLDSVVVLIGSMLIAPMLYSLLAVSLGIVLADGDLLRRAFTTLGKSVVLAFIAAAVIGLFFTGTDLSTIGIINASVPSLAYAIVAGIAGFAAAFAMTKKNLSEMLPGVAISVSLVPPLAVAGIGLAHFDWGIFVNAFLLFLTNVVGIILFAVVVFSLFGFSVKRRVAEKAVRAEDKELVHEGVIAPPAKPEPKPAPEKPAMHEVTKA